jgi:hypothetical protein
MSSRASASSVLRGKGLNRSLHYRASRCMVEEIILLVRTARNVDRVETRGRKVEVIRLIIRQPSTERRAVRKRAGWRALAHAVGFASLLLSRTACGDSLRTYDEIVADARRCVAGDHCLVAGGVRGCRCPVAIRASMQPRVDDAARERSCGQIERLYCPPLGNPRCEMQMCIADEVRE